MAMSPEAPPSILASAIAPLVQPGGRRGKEPGESFFDTLRRAPARHPWLAWLALVVGFGLSVGVLLLVNDEVERKAQIAFGEDASDMAREVIEHARGYADVVFAVRGLLDVSQHVSRAEFHRFARGLEVERRYPGLTSISYAFRVRNDERSAFEQRMLAESADLPPDLPPFAIRSTEARPEYIVLSYVEPPQEAAGVLGFDLSQEPVRNAAVESARDSGTLSTTSSIAALTDPNARLSSFVLRLAVYEGGVVPPTVEARRSAFVGVAGATIRLPEMIRAALSAVAPYALASVRVRVEDVTGRAATSAGTLLFDTAQGADKAAPVLYAKYGLVNRFAIGDRTLAVHITPLAKPRPRGADVFLPHIAGALTMIGALLVFGLVRALAEAEVRGASLRRSLKRLEFHRARLAETQQIANIGGFEWDMRGKAQIWSDHLYRILGRPVGDPPHPDHDFFYANVVHNADAPAVRDALRRVLADRGPVALDCRIVRPDGVERIVSTLTRLEAADDGARTRVVGTVRDITGEWRAAERERAQLQFIQTMMDAIPIPVYQKDIDGRFRACNDAWCRFVGMSRKTMLGRTADEVLPGAHIEAVHAQDQRLFGRVATDSIEVDLRNAAGELRRVMLHKASYAAQDGAIAGLVGAAFDITELRQTKERLEETVAELDRRNRTAMLLGEFGEVLQACLGLDDAYEAIGKYLPRLLPRSSGAVYRLGTGRGNAERCASWGAPVDIPDTMTTTDCVAVRRGQPRCVERSEDELNCRHFTVPPPSYACLPLSSHGELLGLLHVQCAAAGGRACNPETEWPALRSAAEQISLALANLAIRETLREQATRDKLTGLYNRHYLNARFEQDLARASRNASTIGIVLLDMDHFKRFNDTFGHGAGDHVLRKLAGVLEKATRRSDVACRYGGEEFLLLMPDASREIATRRAEEVRVAIKALRLEWEGAPLGPLTVSAGVAAFPVDGSDADTLVQRADQALYRAKELGRDRVEVAMPASVTRSASKATAG